MASQNNAKDLMNNIVLAMSVVILVVFSALVIASLTNSSVFDDIPVTGTNTNETLTNVTNVTESTFAIFTSYSNAICTLGNVYNSSSGLVIAVGNYTNSNCKLILNDSSLYIGEDLNVTYSYSRASGTSNAGVNVTAISNSYGAFVTALIAFLAVMGTILGVAWLIIYVKKLFDKKEGLQGISA